MIVGFAERETARLWRTRRSIRFGAIAERALRSLVAIDSAVQIEDLRFPPGNRLEKLRGDREGQWSIRIDRKWRICFEWEDGNARHVEIVDYH
ncbi:type II toxin-antitoxin system RelE/ParE family toxin [Novosphingobium sp.]|uniref:type II toxin-antitoxin system RelE/ParE family toxin n=1 Tax=Novosphingobium sp. TaxID=1874826 RepID=UPI00286A815B|nr:type II toxin-antitoxin system RelE/ParE family toxin [Novosphingobium sp.]